MFLAQLARLFSDGLELILQLLRCWVYCIHVTPKF